MMVMKLVTSRFCRQLPVERGARIPFGRCRTLRAINLHDVSGQDNRCGHRYDGQFGELPQGYDHKYVYSHLGYNLKATDLQAAIGRVQLERLPGIIADRRRLAALYTSLLSAIPGLQPPVEPAWARSNWQSYCVTLPAHADQLAVMQALLDRGISARRAVMNSHLEPAYAGKNLHRQAGSLEHSEQAQRTGIMLPLFAQMSEDDVRFVVAELTHFLEQVPELAS